MTRKKQPLDTAEKAPAGIARAVASLAPATAESLLEDLEGQVRRLHGELLAADDAKRLKQVAYDAAVEARDAALQNIREARHDRLREYLKLHPDLVDVLAPFHDRPNLAGCNDEKNENRNGCARCYLHSVPGYMEDEHRMYLVMKDPRDGGEQGV